MAVLNLLLFAVAVMQAVVVQEAGAQSGDSGSTMECIEPDPLPERPTKTVADRYLEMRCHLACIEKVSHNEGVTIEVSTEYPAWPMIPDSVLERNCTIYQMVTECRRGCSDGRKCNQRCNDGCCEDCDTMDSCPYACNVVLCQMGCEVFAHLEIIKNQTDAVPPIPAGPIELIIPKDSEVAGLYLMNSQPAIPTVNDNTTERFPTGFVIIVTQFDTSGFSRAAFWMASFEGVLNLEAWACEDIGIALVAVNKFGQTENLVASSQAVEVYGEHPPTSPTNPEQLYFKYETDTRPGYWKHAIVTISWHKPRKGFELLLKYHVSLLLVDPEEHPNCEPRNHTLILDKDETTLSLKAESPLQGPVSDCHYTIKIMSVSTTDVPAPDATEYDMHISSSMTLRVPLNFTCFQTWDEKSGRFGYKASWEVPHDIEVQRAIGTFIVTLELVSPYGEIEQVNYTEFFFSANQSDTRYHYSQEVQHDNRPGYEHQITMTTTTGDYLRRVLVPAPRIHTFPAQAIPPAQVENIHLQKSLFEKVDPSSSTVDLYLEAQWNPASLGFVRYEIRLVREKTYDEESTGLLHSREPHDVRTSVAFTASLPIPIQGPCAYLQVRAISRHNATGNWSQPVCIPLPEELNPASSISQPSYTTQPTPLAGRTKASPDEPLPEVMYIVISVVLVLIVSISILALSVCLAFFQTHKNTKNAKRLRANKVYLSRSVNDKDKYSAGKLDKWEVYSNQVAIQDRLGEGAFGDVYTGLFNSTISGKSEVKKFDANNSVTVAVKRLREDVADKDRQIFLKHILQAKKVAQYPNPHVISLVGCITEQEPLSLLTEYPAQGDLLHYLRAQRQEIFQAQLQLLDYPDSVSGRPLPIVMPQYVSEQGLQAADLMLFISHVAAGLEHLASIGVVHGDVACRNLFLTADKVVKIADFGLDSTSDEEKDLIYVCSESGRLPIRWMAIESIRDSQFSTSSDVWAFGVTLWEIVTLGGFPYHDTANNDILATLGAGQRLECPSNCSEEIYGIMLKCCAATPAERPSFSTLHHVFKSLHTTSNNGQYVTLDIDRTKSYYLASPRSSTTESQTDEYALLMEPVASSSVEAVGMQHTIPHAPGNYYTSHPPPVVPVQHSRSASFNSYTYSDSGFLPCIEEEGEDESETEGSGESMEKEKETVEVEVDSGNDSTMSRESLKGRKHEEGEESERNVEVMGLL